MRVHELWRSFNIRLPVIIHKVQLHKLEKESSCVPIAENNAINAIQTLLKNAVFLSKYYFFNVDVNYV